MEYEIDCEQKCPECGNGFLHYYDCDRCEDGYCDEHEFDPINSPIEGVDLYECHECKGRGIIEWCPKCGYKFE